MRYVPLTPELAVEVRRFMPKPVEGNVTYLAPNHDRMLPPKEDAMSGRQRVEGSFVDLLERAGISDFRFHDLRHTFASWYMMNGGGLYELAKILGHSNIKMTDRYAKAVSALAGREVLCGKCGSYFERATPKAKTRKTDVRVLCAREIFTRFFAAAKLL